MGENISSSETYPIAQTETKSLTTPILHELFGEVGALFVQKHYQDMHDGSAEMDCLSIFALERRNQALDELEACFGPNVRYDPQLVDEYGRKAKILRTDPQWNEKNITTSGSSSLVRLPVIHPHRQILHIDPTPFQPETELPRSSTFRSVYTPENIIRPTCQNGQHVSNARTVRWSNGDVTLHIGNDVYKLHDGDTSKDPHLVADKCRFHHVGVSDGISTAKCHQCNGYRSISQLKAPRNLRLLTPLPSSSVGKALAREKESQRKVNKLEHIPLRKSADSHHASRQLGKEACIFDPNGELVRDVIAHQRKDSIETIRENLLREISTIENAATKLGVIDRKEVLASCQAFRGIMHADQEGELLKLLEQCAAIRRLYRM